jgi:hypothetical protein
MSITMSVDTVIKHRRGLCKCMKIQETVND